MIKRTGVSNAITAGVLFLWAGLVLLGGRKLLNYESTPGMPGAPPSQWPPESQILRPTDKFTLVMLAHPNCPCTRASIAEFDGLMTKLQGKLAGFIVFSKPGATSTEVTASDLWKTAGRIPNVSVLYDKRGVETDRFGGQVSGQTMLYDPQGRLVFSGGITSGRGHQGDNDGMEAVILKVRGLKAQAHVPVFGCTLHDPSAKELSENLWKKQ